MYIEYGMPDVYMDEQDIDEVIILLNLHFRQRLGIFQRDRLGITTEWKIRSKQGRCEIVR